MVHQHPPDGLHRPSRIREINRMAHTRAYSRIARNQRSVPALPLVVQTGSGAEPIPDPARSAPIRTNVSIGAGRRAAHGSSAGYW